jgi:spore coat protein U-like protein
MRISKPCRWLVAGSVLLSTLGGPGAVLAATAGTTFNVTANVVAACTVSASNVAFGSYTAVQLDGSGSISVNCTNQSPYTVELDVGGGSGATMANRKMNGPSNHTLTYSLYQDSSRTTVWGSVAGTQAVAGTGSGTAQALTVYGRIPASQTPVAGSYTDTITVTVTY